ncbi:hypothetical protein K8Z49_35315 [Actinomadura madurae]|uniref:hypothetical protein n=1 Tax=Actinomadura madurae TaxID=1993 RepID=UPI00399B5AC8
MLFRVDWLAPASTALGALLGVSSTLAVERLRWKRGHVDKVQESKRNLYVEYLAALSRTRDELRIAARTSAMPPHRRAERAVEAFKDGRAYELRYQVSVVAPCEIIAVSDYAFRVLRELRDIVESGALHTDERYIRQRDIWEAAFADLRARIRNDLRSD